MGDQTSLPADYGSDNRDRSQTGNLDPYQGSSEFGSGTTGGAGFGNKITGSDEPGEGGYGGNPDLARSSDPYSGNSGYGSGTTGGAGSGNKYNSSDDSSNSSGGGKLTHPSACSWEGGKQLRVLTCWRLKDSKAGKFMEKIGGMLGNEKIEQKGLEKREQAGYGGDNY